MKTQVQRYIGILLLAMGILSACKEDSSTYSQMTISETITNDGGVVSKKEEFLYEDKKLTTHVTTQDFYEQSISLTTSLEYIGNKVVVTSNESGNVAIYTLGTDGYATQCTYQMGEQTREYSFSYSNGYLTNISEKVDGKPTTSNTLTYHQGDLTSIASDGSNEISCETNKIINYSQLPPVILEDVYPLSFHWDAMFAHILGKMTQHMVETLTPVVKVPSKNEFQDKEETRYTYTINNRQQVIGIEEKVTSTGYVYDIYGKAHLTTNSQIRNLSITY